MELRKISYPCKIQWLTRGEGQIGASEKKKLIAEAQRQIGLLHRDMGFQGLSQTRRVVKSGDFVFECKSVMGLDSVLIRMVRGVSGKKVVGQVCWCLRQMSPGIVVAIIDADTSEGKCFPMLSLNYPDCCIGEDYVEKFTGLRYAVHVCQRTRFRTYICIPSDFEEFEVGDKVIVLGLDKWEWNVGSRAACSIPARNKIDDELGLVDTLDGTLVILPYENAEV